MSFLPATCAKCFLRSPEFLFTVVLISSISREMYALYALFLHFLSLYLLQESWKPLLNLVLKL